MSSPGQMSPPAAETHYAAGSTARSGCPPHLMKQIAGEYELDPSTADVTQPDILNKMKVARIYKDGSAWKLDYYLPVREVGHYYDLVSYKHIIQDVYWNQAIGKYLVDSVDWSELDETDVSSADLYFLNVDSKELTIGKYHWIKRQ